MKQFKLFIGCLFFIFLNSISSNAQELTLQGGSNEIQQLKLADNENGSFIEVSADFFKAIENWQKIERDQQMDLARYLKSLDGLDQQEADKFLEVHQKNGATVDARGESCNCTVLTLNVAHEVVPNPSSTYNNDGHYGNNHFWDRDFFKTRYGAATRQWLHLRGRHRQTEFQSSTSGSANSSNSYAMIRFNYLCTSGELQPTDCGCEKDLDIEARYFGRMYVSTETGGVWSKASFAKVEDHAAFFSYVKDNTTFDNQLTNVAVGEAINGFLARSQDSNWNPDFWIQLGEFAAAIYNVISDEEGSFSGTTISDLTTQLVDVVTTGFYESSTDNDGDGSMVDEMSMIYSGGLQLLPNHTTALAMISNGYVYGRGYGGEWRSKAESNSSYMMSAIVPFDNSDPGCCTEQIGKWVSGAAYNAPVNQENLNNIVGSHLTLFAPWDNLSDNDADGNIDVSNGLGIATNDGNCNQCGPDAAVSGLFTSNADVGAGNITLNWVPMEGADYYLVKIFKIHGNGAEAQYPSVETTLNSTVFSNYTNLGSFRFTVTAFCERGEASQESESEYFGIRKKERDRVRENVGFNGNNTFNETIEVFPNPSTDGPVNIQVTQMDAELQSDLLIVRDITGKIVKQFQIEGNKNVSVENLESGIYVIELLSNNTITNTKKLVITKS